MPIVNGKYQNPGWTDNAQPAVSAQNLNDISETLEKLDLGTFSPLVTLRVSAWSNNTQTVTVPGISATESEQMITPVPTIASQSSYYDAGILATGQAANTVTFTADTVPTTNLSVYIVVQEVG